MTIRCLKLNKANMEFDIERGQLRINDSGYGRHDISIRDIPVFSFTEGESITDPITYTFNVQGRHNINIKGSDDRVRDKENPEKIARIINDNLGSMFHATC